MYHRLAHKELELEAQQYAASQTGKTDRPKKGWFSWGSAVAEADTSDSPTLTEEERAQLLSVVGAEDESDGSGPDEDRQPAAAASAIAVGKEQEDESDGPKELVLHLGIRHASVKLHMVDDDDARDAQRVPFSSLRVGDIQLDMEKEHGSLSLRSRVGDLTVVHHHTSAGEVSIVQPRATPQGDDSAPSPICSLDLELSPRGSPDVDAIVELTLSPLDVVLAPAWLRGFAVLFVLPPSMSGLDPLTQPTRRKVGQIAQNAWQSVVESLSSAARMRVQCELSTPLVTLPQDASDPNTPAVHVTLGNLSFHNATDPGVSPDPNYEKFRAHLSNACLWLGKTGHHAALSSSCNASSTDLPQFADLCRLVSPADAEITVCKSRAPGVTALDMFVIEGSLPRLEIRLSIQQLVVVQQCLALAQPSSCSTPPSGYAEAVEASVTFPPAPEHESAQDLSSQLGVCTLVVEGTLVVLFDSNKKIVWTTETSQANICLHGPIITIESRANPGHSVVLKFLPSSGGSWTCNSHAKMVASRLSHGLNVESSQLERNDSFFSVESFGESYAGSHIEDLDLAEIPGIPSADEPLCPESHQSDGHTSAPSSALPAVPSSQPPSSPCSVGADLPPTASEQHATECLKQVLLRLSLELPCIR